MRIWVMGQGKENLVECHLLNIIDGSNDESLIIANFKETINEFGGELLGEYSTKEKALKVLDMIRKHIECGDKQTIQTNEDEWLHYNADVFQMPQDEEVEV